VVQFSRTSRVLIIGQAPGTRVHASGVPWDDQSGARLREWTDIVSDNFYDPAKVALMPMGFCYPGKGKSGDLPPRPECAPLWHDAILEQLPPDHLTLLVGQYAQARYLPRNVRGSLSANVQAFASFLPKFFPLPHPSWRSTGWMARNPWFERKVLPALREAVRTYLD
jgi:uracil-DNA glycosylase